LRQIIVYLGIDIQLNWLYKYFMRLAVCTKETSVESLFQVSGAGTSNLLCANTYLITGEYPILIEAGSEKGYDHLCRNLGYFGLKMSDIKVVLATHGHWDHISGMERLHEESDAQLLVPTEDVEAVENGDDSLTVASFYGQSSKPIKVAGEVYENFRLRAGKVTIEAIKTPWHTPGSVCYKVIQPNSTTLIAGDTYFGYYFAVPGRDVQADMEAGKESLRRLREHEFDRMSMGHVVLGFMDDVAVRLEEAERQFASFDVVKVLEEFDGPLTPKYVSPWQKIPGQHFMH
jgi:glyoxylase-like metal-dependent hydrolase (beta-lactamase superfamily II)